MTAVVNPLDFFLGECLGKQIIALKNSHVQILPFWIKIKCLGVHRIQNQRGAIKMGFSLSVYNKRFPHLLRCVRGCLKALLRIQKNGAGDGKILSAIWCNKIIKLRDKHLIGALGVIVGGGVGNQNMGFRGNHHANMRKFALAQMLNQSAVHANAATKNPIALLQPNVVRQF